MRERMSAAELRQLHPEYDHSDQPSRVTAAEFNGTVGKAWDRPLEREQDTNERDFQNRVIRAFELNGFKVYHTVDPRKCRAGFPDLRIVGKGFALTAELKVKVGPQAIYPEQVEWLDAEAEAMPDDTYLWLPLDWPDIVRWLARGENMLEPSRWVNRRELYVKGE